MKTYTLGEFYRMDDQERLDATAAWVEANSFETLVLWQTESIEGARFVHRVNEDLSRRKKWEQVGSGLWRMVGKVGKVEIYAQVFWYLIDGYPVGFYSTTSNVVDHRKVEKYFKISDRQHANAMNFHTVNHYLTDLKEGRTQ